MRFEFGGVADYVVTLGGDGAATLVPGATLTFYDSEAGGEQITDLVDLNGDPISDGTLVADAYGAVPPFRGPDGTYRLWVSADGGPRRAMVATDVGRFAQVAETANAAIAQHTSDGNPHQMRIGDLVDVDDSSPSDGQALIWSASAGAWIPAVIPGVTNVITTDSDQTVTGVQKTFVTDPSKPAIVLQAAPDGSQSSDLLVGYWWDGTAYRRTGYLNEKGELRARPGGANSVPLRVAGYFGQLARLTEWTTSDGTPLAWLESDGRLRAPNMSTVPPFAVAGEVSAGAGAHRWYNDTGAALTIRSVRASAGTPPTGADLIVDVHVNGSTIFTDQGSRPAIGAGTNTSGPVVPNVTTVPAAAYITVDIDQVGSVDPGADLTVQILAY